MHKCNCALASLIVQTLSDIQVFQVCIQAVFLLIWNIPLKLGSYEYLVYS